MAMTDESSAAPLHQAAWKRDCLLADPTSPSAIAILVQEDALLLATRLLETLQAMHEARGALTFLVRQRPDRSELSMFDEEPVDPALEALIEKAQVARDVADADYVGVAAEVRKLARDIEARHPGAEHIDTRASW